MPNEFDPRLVDLDAALRGPDGARVSKELNGFLARLMVLSVDDTTPIASALRLWERVSDTAIRVNLDCPVTFPFAGATPFTWRAQSGQVTVELRDGELYVEGNRVELFLAREQEIGRIKGRDLRNQVVNQLVLHPNIMDALCEAWDQGLHLIPEDWKQNQRGDCLTIAFWAVGFCDAEGRPYVRFFYWGAGRWCRLFLCLDLDWDVRCPAAVSASFPP